MVKINQQKIKNLLNRNVEQVIESANLKKRLLKGEKLRIKHGIDPTGPKIHLGHAIILWKLKEFQDLGHTIVLILGDYTAQIGDPSDKLAKRPFLSEKQVKENLKNYQKQIGKILNIKKVEWHRNSEWLKKLSIRQLDGLAELFSVQQMMARRNFKERWKKQEEISIREFHYPLYQGYDSVMIRADLEIGGTDQLFNLLAGRRIQPAYQQTPQDIMTLKMLTGLDNHKMSKTKDNVIYITDSPTEQYGKIMSIPDHLISHYFELCTPIKNKEIQKIVTAMKQGANPRDFKAKLAYQIVELYYGTKEAQKAEQEFNQVFRDKQLPANITTYKIKKQTYRLIDLLVETKLTVSKSEARRLVEHGAVKVDGKLINDWSDQLIPKNGMIIKVGKRRFIKLLK